MWLIHNLEILEGFLILEDLKVGQERALLNENYVVIRSLGYFITKEVFYRWMTQYSIFQAS